MNAIEIDQLLKPLLIKDVRAQLRQRGLNPGGSLEALRDRLKEHMVSTNDFELRSEDGTAMGTVQVTAGANSVDVAAGKLQNNYARPNGQQNVGNFLTDKPSSRVLAAPGGGSSITFGDYQDPHVAKHNAAIAASREAQGMTNGKQGNNYSRPEGQNVGNMLSDKPSSRVLAAPGGGSQIIFG